MIRKSHQSTLSHKPISILTREYDSMNNNILKKPVHN